MKNFGHLVFTKDPFLYFHLGKSHKILDLAVIKKKIFTEKYKKNELGLS